MSRAKKTAKEIVGNGKKCTGNILESSITK